MQENCVHYVASDKPLGTPLGKKINLEPCVEVSAGHSRHEYTTGYAYDEIVKLFGLV